MKKNKDDYYVEGIKQVPLYTQIGFIIGVIITSIIIYILK